MSAVYLIADEKEVNSLRDRDFYAGVCGSGTVVLNVGNKMAATIGASTVTISDGVCVDEGGRIQIDYGDAEEFTIPTGTTGVNTTYYIGFMVGTDGSCEQFVSTSKPTETSIRSGASSKYVTLYSVTQTGTSISSVTALFSEQPNISELTKSMEWTMDMASYNESYVSGAGYARCLYNDKLFHVHAVIRTKTNVPAGATLLTLPIKDTVTTNQGIVGHNGSNIATITIGSKNGALITNLAIASGYTFDLNYWFKRS